MIHGVSKNYFNFVLTPFQSFLFMEELYSIVFCNLFANGQFENVKNFISRCKIHKDIHHLVEEFEIELQ